MSIALNFLPGVFICYGAIMGIGLGVGYLTPVKNLMLWFADNKGLATGIAVAGFGLAKAIASPLMEYLIGTVGLVSMFFILAAVYAVMMFVGFLLIKRPAGWVYDPATSHVSRKTILKKPVFWGIWIAFYINITCGLALISQEKDILHDVLRAFPQYANLSPAKFAAAISGIIGLVLAVDSVFNTAGRVGFSTLSDHLKRRETVYQVSSSCRLPCACCRSSPTASATLCCGPCWPCCSSSTRAMVAVSRRCPCCLISTSAPKPSPPRTV